MHTLKNTLTFLMRKSTSHVFSLIVSLMFILVSHAAFAANLNITNVSVDRRDFTPGEAPISVRFSINNIADVSLVIYDSRDVEIYRATKKDLNAGEHTLLWKGVDRLGRAVPPEAYFYTLTSTNKNNETVVFDKTDITGGKPVIVQDIHYDSDTETVRYVIPQPSRVFLRAGLKNAFIIKTLINGTVRDKGIYKQHWNGSDDKKLISVKGRENYSIYGKGFTLSDNAIIVKPSKEPVNNIQEQTGSINWPNSSTWISGLDLEKKRKIIKKSKGLDPYAYQPVEHLKDVTVNLLLPDTLKKNKNGHAIIPGSIPLTVDVPLDEALAIESQRLEVMYFLNTTLIYENEASYLPYTWVWYPQNLPPGEHYLTIFMVGFGQRFGVSINKIEIPTPNKPST